MLPDGYYPILHLCGASRNDEGILTFHVALQNSQ